MGAAPQGTQGERRYYGLDALRGGMMMLGVVLHASELYLAAPPPQYPIPVDRNTSLVCDALFHFIHAFRMPVFFVLAGFFAALLVEKRGLWETYKNRAARVLAPLLAALVTILPLTILLMLDFIVAAKYGVYQLLPERSDLERLQAELTAQGHPVDKPSPLHLWFLLYLCYFYALLGACRWLARALQRWEQAILGVLGWPLLVVPLGMGTAALLLPYRGAQVLEGFIYFEPHLPSLAYYGSFFVLGYLLRHFPAPLRTASRHAPAYGFAGAALFALALYASHLDYASGADAAMHLAASIANGLCTWALVYFFIGCALRWFDRPATWILYASQSSYWVFLVHMPLVGLAGWWLARYDVPALAKFSLSVAFVSTLCFASYHFLVQRSWVSVFLNGKRFNLPPPWRRGDSRVTE